MASSASINISTRPQANLASNSWSIDGILRRAMDILASFGGLMILAPFFLFIAVQLRRDSPGPVFFRGWRVGKNGRKFHILKFRTMYECPESYAGPSITNCDDDRVTPFGRWLRDTKLNELPQLWNVLVGEMSLVGPRPEDPDIAAQWPEGMRREILSVRPGMTSPASIIFKEEEKLLTSDNLMEDYLVSVLPSKLRLDLLYIRHPSILHNLDIIFLTFVALLPLLRKVPIPEKALYLGPLHQVFQKFINWFVLDWLVTWMMTIFSGLVWRIFGPLNAGFLPALVISFFIAFLFSVINGIVGLNKNSWSTAPASAVWDLGVSAAIATVIMILANNLVTFPIMLPDKMLLTVGILSIIGSTTIRYRERLITGFASRWLGFRNSTQPIGEQVLIIGAGEMGRLVSWLLRQGEFGRAFCVAGFVDDDIFKNGFKVNGAPILGSTADLPDLIIKRDIGLVIFAISNILSEQRQRILAICEQADVQVKFFPEIMDAIRAGLLTNFAVETPSFIKRSEVKQALTDLDHTLQAGNLEQAREKLAELRMIYSSQEGYSSQ